MKTAELIRTRINETPLGEPFTPAAFLALGTRATVDQTLSRLVKEGFITRVSRGVFVRPTQSRYVGKATPEPSKIAEAIAKTTGATIQVHGAEAARRLALTTQTPTQPVFYTSGPSKRIQVGKLTVTLKHASPRKLALAGRPAGLALAALWYLGKEEVTENVIAKIRKKLSPEEFLALRSATASMPAWMTDALYKYERNTRNG
ncbi:MAG: DUF6088 family protein [Pseudomonadota bacterium]